VHLSKSDEPLLRHARQEYPSVEQLPSILMLAVAATREKQKRRILNIIDDLVAGIFKSAAK